MRTLSPQWRSVLIGSWVMILVLSIGFLILYVDNKRTRECMATYMRKDAAATAPRLQAAADRNAAMDRLVATMLTVKTGAETRRALEEYDATTEAAETKRLASPPPPFPEGCA